MNLKIHFAAATQQAPQNTFNERPVLVVANRHISVMALILILSILLRLAAALYLGDDTTNWIGGTADQVSYDTLAQRLLAGHGFSFAEEWWPATAAGAPTAHWSYLYTIFLAAVYALVGHHPLVARLIQAILTGILMPWLTYRVGQRAFSRAVGLLAAAFIAVYFYFVIFSAALMTEAFYTVALLWLVDITIRLARRLAASSPGSFHRLGLELGLAIAALLLLRQVGLFIVLVVVAWLLYIAWRHNLLRRLLAPLALAALLTTILLLPWTVRNYLAFGTLSILPNTNSGFALYWANHPVYGTQFQTVISPDTGVTYYELIPAELRHLNEARLDQALTPRAVQFILDEPGRYLLLSLSRIPIHFQFWPTSDSSLLANAARLLSFGLALPFIIAGLAIFLVQSLRHLRRHPRWPLRPLHTPLETQLAIRWLIFAMIVIYNLLHILTWAKVRYRLPTDALMLLFAAFALVWLGNWWRDRRSATPV